MNILQIFFDALGRDPRPTRFYKELCALGSVTVCSAPPVQGFRPEPDFQELVRPRRSFPGKLLRAANLLAHRYEADIWTPQLCALIESLRSKKFSLIVCHDILLLPLAEAVRNQPHNKGRCAVVMDAREFYPKQFEHSRIWKIMLGGLNDYACRRYLAQSDLVFTVSPGLAQGYATEYNVNCIMLPSLPDYHDIIPHATAEPIRCIHHGVAAPGRKLELMIEAFIPLMGKAELDFMLMPSDRGYLAHLEALARGAMNIRFIAPVPMQEIVPCIAAYDMGVFLLQPNTFNHKHALPNKLFEFIQARLGVAVSPVPDMAGIVRRHGVGIVAEDFTAAAMTKAFQNVPVSAINAFKARANSIATELCWERNAETIRERLSSLLEAQQ